MLAIAVAFLGLGLANVELALVVLAVPPIVTNAYVAVDSVDRDLVDAARGMGMTEWQVLRRVELPLALPLIFAGIRTAAVFVVATTTISALAGYSGTLGDVINNETSYRISGVLGGAICVAALALAVEATLAGAQRLLTPRGLRAERASRISYHKEIGLSRSTMEEICVRSLIEDGCSPLCWRPARWPQWACRRARPACPGPASRRS